MEKSSINSFVGLKKLFLGYIISMITSFVCLIIYACVLVNTSLQENSMNIIIIIINCLSIFCGSVISSKIIKSKGIINGFGVGLIYLISLYLISSIICNNFSLNFYSVIIMVCGSIVGGIGGIIGVNIK